MPDNSKPTVPNYVPGVGALTTYRADFQSHINGTAFNHDASAILLSPNLTIGGTVYTDVQDALNALNAFAVVPTLARATVGTLASNLGVITLGGDLGGTALIPKITGLRGKPVNNTPPVLGNVLTWGGTSWGPAIPHTFTAGGDLSGNNIAQQVISITGDTTTNPGFNTITSSGSYLRFNATVPQPTITQTTTGSGNGATLTISAQSTSGDPGGALHLSSGAGNTPGNINLHLGGVGLLAQMAYVPSTNSRVVSLATSANLTTTQMPANTGDLVVYVGNATTNPTATPSNGAILYSTGGQLWTMDGYGNNLPLANANANPQTFGTLSLTSGTVLTYLNFATTPASGGIEQIAMLTYTPPIRSTILVETTVIAKGADDASSGVWILRDSFITGFDGVITEFGGAYQTTDTPRLVLSASTWGPPQIFSFGTTVQILSGESLAYAHVISWVAKTTITVVETS